MKLAKEMSKTFAKENMQFPDKHMNRCLTPLDIREM